MAEAAKFGAQQLIEGQGNAVLMGNVDLLDSTAIIHQYTPEQNPELLVRRTHDVGLGHGDHRTRRGRGQPVPRPR